MLHVHVYICLSRPIHDHALIFNPQLIWIEAIVCLGWASTRIRSSAMKTATEFWTGGRKGTLSAKSQIQIWALMRVNKKYDLGMTLQDIANEVWVIGKPRRHPSHTAIKGVANDF